MPQVYIQYESISYMYVVIIRNLEESISRIFSMTVEKPIMLETVTLHLGLIYTFISNNKTDTIICLAFYFVQVP